MFTLSNLAVAALLLASLDIPLVYTLQQRLESPHAAALSAVSYAPADIFLAAADQVKNGKLSRLQPQSELAIVRFVDGEFTHVVKPLPAVKKGFHYKAGAPFDEKALEQSLARHGSAANPGDTVQITDIEFLPKELVISINGGSKKHFDLRRHLQISMGGMPTTTVQRVSNVPGLHQAGATLVLEFDGSLPDMSPDDVKHYLSPFLNFAAEHSSAVNWVETLPPQFREAIKDRRAMVGMNRDMVLAAMGRPDQKIRETNAQGVETEDWIYGHPPAKTVFVTFAGDKVIRVEQFF